MVWEKDNSNEADATPIEAMHADDAVELFAEKADDNSAGELFDFKASAAHNPRATFCVRSPDGLLEEVEVVCELERVYTALEAE